MKNVLTQVITIFINISFVRTFCNQKIKDVIYILIWSPIAEMPFGVTQSGQGAFTRRGCTFINCFITDQHSFFKNILDFDVIMFNLIRLQADMDLPSNRSENQKYVLVAIEPSGTHKVPREFNKFFNLTWTYKLDSDVPFPYIVVKNKNNEIVGPKKEMHWLDVKDMNKTGNHIKEKLQRKKVAAAWFASDSDVPGSTFVGKLQNELVKYNHSIDIYGNCVEKKCPVIEIDHFYALIESTYYFDLAFENAFCADYVTEKVLTGIKHYAVPVVFGSANYTRQV